MAYDPGQLRHPAGTAEGGQWMDESSIELVATDERAYRGRQAFGEEKLSKQETGRLGEQVAVAYLRQQGLADARPLNMDQNNFPIDLIEDHELIEVKTGLVTNSRSAQQWRATIGQPGKKEREWLKVASPDAKRTWNEQKARAIMDRKRGVLDDYTKRHGIEARGKTLATIIDPERKLVDVYEFDGFHLRIGWNSSEASNGYKGTFSYG